MSKQHPLTLRELLGPHTLYTYSGHRKLVNKLLPLVMLFGLGG